MTAVKKIAGICNAEAALLGLLSEAPSHPYQIVKDVEMRDMQSWSDLSRATIYKMLRRLELKKMVSVKKRTSQGERSKHIYHLQPSGRKALREFLRTQLSTHETVKSPFDVAIYWSDSLSRQETLRCLRAYGEQLDEAVRFWKCMVFYLVGCGCPSSDQALCDRKAYMLQGEKQWLDHYIKELENE